MSALSGGRSRSRGRGSRPLLRVPRRLLRLRSDATLAERVAAGDDSAFELLYERHRPVVLAVCIGILGTAHDAEDATQEAFSALALALRRDPPAELRPWLIRVARNAAIDITRRRKLRPLTLDGAIPDLEAHPASAGKAEFAVVLAGIRELPENQRTALLMRELGGHSYTEIAEFLETDENAVRGLIARARVGLRNYREAAELPCAAARKRIETEPDSRHYGKTIRRHLRGCASCRAYRQALRRDARALRAALPLQTGLVFGSSSGLATGALGAAKATLLGAGMTQIAATCAASVCAVGAVGGMVFIAPTHRFFGNSMLRATAVGVTPLRSTTRPAAHRRAAKNAGHAHRTEPASSVREAATATKAAVNRGVVASAVINYPPIGGVRAEATSKPRAAVQPTSRLTKMREGADTRARRRASRHSGQLVRRSAADAVSRNRAGRNRAGGHDAPAPAVSVQAPPAASVQAPPAASVQAPPAASVQAPPAASVQAPPAAAPPAQAQPVPPPAPAPASPWVAANVTHPPTPGGLEPRVVAGQHTADPHWHSAQGHGDDPASSHWQNTPGHRGGEAWSQGQSDPGRGNVRAWYHASGSSDAGAAGAQHGPSPAGAPGSAAAPPSVAATASATPTTSWGGESNTAISTTPAQSGWRHGHAWDAAPADSEWRGHQRRSALAQNGSPPTTQSGSQPTTQSESQPTTQNGSQPAAQNGSQATTQNGWQPADTGTDPNGGYGQGIGAGSPAGEPPYASWQPNGAPGDQPAQQP